MIKQLRIRIIVNVMAIFTIIILVVGIIFFISIDRLVENQCDTILQFLLSMDGTIPSKMMAYLTPIPFSIFNTTKLVGIFSVKQDIMGNIYNVVFNNGYTISNNELIRILRQIPFDQMTTNGEIPGFRYLAKPTTYGRLVVCINSDLTKALSQNLQRTALLIMIAAWLLVLIIVTILSFYVAKPVQVTLDNQNILFAHVIHDLKAPAGVISINADVLGMEIGENKWLSYIKNESQTLSFLINNYLSFTKLKSNESQLIRQPFNISKCVLTALLPYESTFFEKNKHFSYEVEEDIIYNGNEEDIKRLVSIFIDNAINYSKEEGEIEFKLKKIKNGKQIEMTFYNTGIGIPSKEQKRIFKSFYQVNSSDSFSSGNYGLGLAIAAQIVKQYKGKILVNSEVNKNVIFTVIL